MCKNNCANGEVLYLLKDSFSEKDIGSLTIFHLSNTEKV